MQHVWGVLQLAHESIKSIKFDPIDTGTLTDVLRKQYSDPASHHSCAGKLRSALAWFYPIASVSLVQICLFRDGYLDLCSFTPDVPVE